MKHTKAALKIWDADQPRLDKLLHEAQTNEDVYDWQAEEEKAKDLVCTAFFEDTKHVNSKDHAKLIHPNDPWVRGLVNPTQEQRDRAREWASEHNADEELALQDIIELDDAADENIDEGSF